MDEPKTVVRRWEVVPGMWLVLSEVVEETSRAQTLVSASARIELAPVVVPEQAGRKSA